MCGVKTAAATPLMICWMEYVVTKGRSAALSSSSVHIPDEYSSIRRAILLASDRVASAS